MPVKKILIVDDSPTERQALTELLHKHGYQIFTRFDFDGRGYAWHQWFSGYPCADSR